MTEEDNKPKSRCPECGTVVKHENITTIEEGDYRKYDCPTCEDPQYREHSLKDGPDAPARNNPNSPIVQMAELEAERLERFENSDITVIDEGDDDSQNDE